MWEVEKSVEPSLTTVSQINDQCITSVSLCCPLQAAETGDLERILAEKSKKVGSELLRASKYPKTFKRLDLQISSMYVNFSTSSILLSCHTCSGKVSRASAKGCEHAGAGMRDSHGFDPSNDYERDYFELLFAFFEFQHQNVFIQLWA